MKTLVVIIWLLMAVSCAIASVIHPEKAWFFRLAAGANVVNAIFRLIGFPKERS